MEQDWNARGDVAESERMRDWIETQARVADFWLERCLERSDTENVTHLNAFRDELLGWAQRV